MLALAFLGCQPREGAEEASAAEQEPQAPPAPPDSTPTVVLETNMGRIVMEFDATKAPRTVRNIVRHVEAHFYDSIIFHRVIPGFMIQAGQYTPDMNIRSSSAAPVPHEGDNGLSNVRGSVALARTNDPHSGARQFFINLVTNRNLDFGRYPDGFGYTVFGRVIEGMDVVDRIARVPTEVRGSNERVPVEPVIIVRAYVAEEEQPAEP
ncbi:MAG: peptidyl-prolyl cis-trans isomerase [Gemmatimonadales bacterium]|nr:peptidyl-prolyl cis-trans isomerase [Gemmatimonadales bacterium]NIN12515.1 peptidyl-prolyl cis-trans isomerase [Gemmatimonadales bacterium]NIN50886.1 peptidyl-prolyl cis-trans isomerase [Gemmatimonadales bacterium]NIP08350.1 peptidyl-prolyl cis-trans isomerase [Gemmatimonadales bacterium]NIR03447.1 peptidyl-prolyl cis-trans isomerase [Gemmatimonadales bacterium]